MALTSDSAPEGLDVHIDRRLLSVDDMDIEYGIWLPEGGADTMAIALHGFSRPFEDMLAVRPLLPPRTALLMPHLAAHGRSSGQHRPLDPAAWQRALIERCTTEGLPFNGTLIGYSLGGRVALHWWASSPEQFTRVLLLAPDGLVRNPGYAFAVDSVLGRTWLEQSERQRTGIIQVGRWLHRRGLLPDHFFQFSMFHLESKEMWNMVVNCWLSLRRCWPPGRRKLARLAAAHPGALQAHFGERDKVIRPRNAQTLNGVCPVHFHPCGHGLLRPDIVKRIASPSSES